MNNEVIFKDWLKEREPVLDLYYRREIDSEFIEKAVESLINFYNLIDDNDFEIEDLRKYINFKIKGKCVLSYSSFSKYLNIHNLTLDLCKTASDNVLREFVKQFKDLFKKENIDYKNVDHIKHIALSFYMSKSSQSKGESYKKKLRIQFEDAGYSESELELLQPLEFTFSEKAINNEIVHRGISFEWSENKQGKSPDFAFVSPDNTLYVGEHKNFKEGGGHQNTVGVEIIDMIKQPSTDEIKWISYADGPYFNEIKDSYNPNNVNNKFSKQINEIEKLVNETDNYFVGTKTFERLIKEVKDGK